MDNINAKRPLTTITVSELNERFQIVMNWKKINQVGVEDKVQEKEEICEEDNDEKEDDDEKEASGVRRQKLITD